MMTQDLIQIAMNMVEASNGRLRLAQGEEDESRQLQPEAATFLKLDERRFGRDLELYNFLGTVTGQGHALSYVAEEIVLPLRSVCRESYFVGADAMKVIGRKYLEGAHLVSWLEIWN